MDRRAFLIGSSSLTLAQLLSGCSNQSALRVRLLKNSVPPQLIGEFQQQLNSPVTLKFDPEIKIKALFESLQGWKQQGKKEDLIPISIPYLHKKLPPIADLVTLGDFWLESAITQKLIEPLDLSQLAGWKQLPARWRELVQRDGKGQMSQSGAIWGAPYRWGTTVIAYNQDKFKNKGWAPPKDWADLWRPELRGRISLLDQPREVIGLTLKNLGESYNTTDLSRVPDLKEELLSLHKQVKLYSSARYLEPLILGHTDVAVAWSTDILPLRNIYSDIKAIVPQSGTAIWADLWVQPNSEAAANLGERGERQALIKQWINFCWQTKPAQEISLFSDATSPIITSGNPALPEDLRNNRLLLPETSILNKSEFLQPLPQSVLAEYMALWKTMRLSKVEVG